MRGLLSIVVIIFDISKGELEVRELNESTKDLYPFLLAANSNSLFNFVKETTPNSSCNLFINVCA